MLIRVDTLLIINGGINLKTKIVFSAGMAKKLLKDGFVIVDIDANKADKTRTVFFFNLQDGLLDAIDRYTKTNK